MAARMLGGRYELLDRLGSGGMAEVWRARDEQLGRMVAVKLLLEHLVDDPGFVERFRREARHSAALAHPNIVVLHDWGIEGQTPYLVMEVVDGMTLRQRLRSSGRLPVAETVSIARQVLAALHQAHDRGIVHRDIKPENILIGHLGEAQHVKVSDFGVATAIGDVERLTRGGMVGTPSYVSPEQAAGQPVSPATDIYSIGCVLFECLSGFPPSPVFSDQQHASDLDGLRAERPDVSDQIVRTIRRALALDPAARFSSTPDMALSLVSEVALPVAVVGEDAKTVTGATPDRRTPRRRVAVRVAAVVAALVVVAAIVSALRSGGSHRVVSSGFAASRAGENVEAVLYLGLDKNLWLYDVAVNRQRRLTKNGASVAYDLPGFVNGAAASFVIRGSTSAGASTPDVLVEVDLRTGAQKQVVRSVAEIEDYSWRPDGGQLVYLVNGAVQSVDLATGASKTLRQLPNESRITARATFEDEARLDWSPDGRFVLVTDTFVSPPAQSTMWVLHPDGTDAVDPTEGTFGRWANHGQTVYFKRFGSAQPWYALSVADGSRATLPLRADALDPQVGPDGSSLVYNDSEPNGVIFVFDGRTGTERRLGSGLADPIWLAPDKVAAARAGACTRGSDCSSPWDERPGTVEVDVADGRQHNLPLSSTAISGRWPPA
jgi:serine/threonine-protein kinase